MFLFCLASHSASIIVAIKSSTLISQLVKSGKDCWYHSIFPAFNIHNIYQSFTSSTLLFLALFSSESLANKGFSAPNPLARSEERTSELQSRENLVCRLLLATETM